MAYQPKSYRKFLATSVTAAMVATVAAPFATPAQAAANFPDVPASHWASDAIDYLVEKGALEGRPNGSFDPTASITRGEAAKILAITLGLEVDLNAKTDFADAANHWASPYIAAIQAQTEDVINGYENGTFRPNNNITRQEMAKMVVTAYGLELDAEADVEFNDNNGWGAEFVNVLASLGIVEGMSEGSFNPNGLVTRAQTPVFVQRTEVPEVRVEVPTKAPAVVDLAVESVSANNLKTVAVTFNQAVDKKTVTANTAVLKDGNATVITTTTLSEDGKTLYITSSGNLDQNKEYNVTLSGVKTTDGKELAQYEGVVKVLDVAVPTVDGVKLTSPKTLEIQFSEPVNFTLTPRVLTDIVQINGINAYASNIVVDNATGKVTLTLGTALTPGAHKVKVAKVSDFAGFPIAATEFDVTLAEDNVAPEAAAVEVLNKDQVKVTFSEPVDHATVTANLANIKVNNQAVNTPVVKEGGKVYEFTLASSLGLAAVVEATLEYKGIKDFYGNEVTTAKTFKFQAVDDTTAPTVTSTVVNNDNTVEVTFSKDVVGFDAASDVELYDQNNKKLSNAATITPKTIDGVVSKKVYTVSFADGINLSGAKTIKILKDKVTDLSIRENKFAETSLSVTLNDKVAPKIVNAKFVNEDGTADHEVNKDTDNLDSKVTITFDKKMDAATLTNKSNYILGGKPLADVIGATLTAGADNKSVTITINASTASEQIAFTANNANNLRVLGVKDAAGNTLNTSDLNRQLDLVQFVANVDFDDVIDVAKVEVTAKNKLKLYATTGNKIQAVDPNKLSVVIADGADADTEADLAAQVTGATIAEDGSSVELTLSQNLNADTTFGTGSAEAKLLADAVAVTTTDGVKTLDVSATNAFAEAIVLVDKVAPTLKEITRGANTDEIVVTFDEGIAQETATVATQIANDLVVKVNGTELDITKGEFEVVVDATADNHFTIKVLKDGIVDATDVTVALNNGRYVVDTASTPNRANTFAATTITLATGEVVTEKVLPTFSASITDTNEVTVVFNEEVKKADAELVANYVYDPDGTGTGAAEEIVSATLQADGKTVKIVTTTAPTTGTSTIDATVEDIAGNTSASAAKTL